MRGPTPWGLLLFTFATLCTASLPSTSPATPLVLPPDFTPPQVFNNTNLLRTIDLTRPYSREVIAVIVENGSNQTQTEYYVPFAKEVVDRVSYVEARDKAGPGGDFIVRKVEFDEKSPVQYYRIDMAPLAPSSQITLQLTIGLLHTATPRPATVSQVDKQFLFYRGSRYFHSAYPTLKQKTKLRFPNPEVPEYTKFTPKAGSTDDPAKAGSFITYGPYELVKVEEKGGEPIELMYEYTAPVITANTLERDIEVSHWGGNMAVEERYTITNKGAKLKDQFSRVTWAATSYYNPPTHAIKSLTFDLGVGASDPYYTDEIGNISTSRFRSNSYEALLELKPRFPIFGGWNASFVIGWNHELGKFLRTDKKDAEQYVLKVPFLEGPKEPIVYDEVEVTVILPEGATDVSYISPIDIDSEERYLHKTFMDTLGRTALKLKVRNVADEAHGKELIVMYRYPKFAGLRKPLVFFTGLMSLFLVSWLIGKVDTRIAK
ncbi:Ribophorin I [Ascodesmis nigricans]|uniref:Dolichyl-diphosphooligosaccharide--protein glycosyltransferase subunit 1 n=1 Tax=Ascodesmis nigricans TaxID=341454 RepID=A0A4S2N1J9_9PEZI|nr:Ribophorin I [Ascodesmis nigricans]